MYSCQNCENSFHFVIFFVFQCLVSRLETRLLCKNGPDHLRKSSVFSVMSYSFSSSYRVRQTQGGLSYVCALRKNVRLIYLSSVLIFLGSGLSQKTLNISFSVLLFLALTVFLNSILTSAYSCIFVSTTMAVGSFHSRCISCLTKDHFFNTKLATDVNLYFNLRALLAGLIKDLFPEFEAELLIFPLDTIQHKFQTSKRPQRVCLTLGNISKIFPFKKHICGHFSGSVVYLTIHAVCYFKGKMNF